MAQDVFVRIRPTYALRGWRGLPYALVGSDGSGPYFLTADAYRTAQLCNGHFPASSPVFQGHRAAHIEKFDALGVIEYLEAPQGLLPSQRYRLFDNRYLRQVHWSLTGSCNYRCRHCYMSAPHAVLPQPTTEQCLAIADQIADCGVMRVSLTGGEPLVRHDFFAIVDRILEHGIRIDTIMTNGSLVDDTFLDELDARDCHPVLNMSFDGPRAWHDWLRGVDGAYDSVRRALSLCRERGFATGAELVLHKGNLGSLRESVRELGELGVGSLKVSRLTCVGEGAALSDYALTASEEYEAYLEFIPRYLEDGMPVPYLTLAGAFCSLGGDLFIPAERHPEGEDCRRKVICRAARMTMYLGPDGRILPCIPLSQRDSTSRQFPSVADMTLAEALSDSFYLDFISTTLGDYLEHNPSCAACAYRNRCGGGCRGEAVDANGGSDLMGIDPSTCLFYQGGYYERVKGIIEQYGRDQTS